MSISMFSKENKIVRIVITAVVLVLAVAGGFVIKSVSSHDSRPGAVVTHPTKAVHDVKAASAHHITLELIGSRNVDGQWADGERHTHTVHGPFQVTLLRRYSVYGITASLLSKATKSGDIVTTGNLTAKILIDGKLVAQEKTGPDKTSVNLFVYRDFSDDQYSTVPH